MAHAQLREGRRVAPPRDDDAALVVRIAQILQDGYVLDTTVSPASLQLPQGDDAVVSQDVRVEGRLTRMAEQVYFQGRVRGVVAVLCSRCLKTTHADFIAETQIVFLPPTFDVSSNKEAGVSTTDELDLYIHDGTTLDLRPLVREQVVLAFPIQSLCHTDCAGLCQVCGGNRNEEACTCQSDSTDPRFAVLHQFRLPNSS